MNRIDRLFGILTLLQSRKYVSAEKISEKFGISIRTVYRDMKAIGEQGIPVSFEPGKGYFIVQGYFLPPVSFTSDEAAALLLMENIVNAFSDKSIQKNYSSALNKVRAVMPQEQKEKLDFLARSTRSQYPERFKNDYEYMTILQNSITSKTVVEIAYKNSKDESTRRTVEPIGLVFYAFAWHLIAWCTLRNDYRDFKIERIVNIRETGLPFKKEKHLTLNDYIKHLPVAY
jgi:predicted DNA-binding transcriptional regulator YafY